MCRKICASVLLLLLVASVATSVAEAASELPLEPRVLNQVQSAARSFINERTVDGAYLYYDVATEELKRLEFKMLHPLVSMQGDLYVARADFFDDEGRPVGMKFLVVIRDERPHTLQAVAHMMGSEAAAPCADTS